MARKRAKAKPKPELPKYIDSRYELAYLRLLERYLSGGLIQAFYLKPGSLRTGDGVRYEPDFLIIDKEGLVEYHEVKGASRFAAKGISKLRMVAHMYQDFKFVLVKGTESKTSGILFEYEDVS